MSIGGAACRCWQRRRRRRRSPTHPALDRNKRGVGRYTSPGRPSSYLQRAPVRCVCGATGRFFIASDPPRGGDLRRRRRRGGCRVVRAGWSSYPTGVLRASTYPSGHVALLVVRRSSDVVRFFCLAADRRFKFTIKWGGAIFYTRISSGRVFFFLKKLIFDRLIT